MATSQPRYFQIMMDALASFDATQDVATLGQRLADAVATFGYRHVCIAAAPGAFALDFNDKVLLNSWPKGWFEQYRQSNFTSHDPVAMFLRRQTRAFAWSEAPIPPDDPMAQSVMAISSADYEMRHGFSIPIHGLHGYQAGVSFAGPEVENAQEAYSAVQMIGIFAFSRLTTLRASTKGGKLLSPRESEVMTWAAAGKTSWDTSGIMSIAEDTVNKHIASAMRKLNVHTRAHAIAESIRRGEIRL